MMGMLRMTGSRTPAGRNGRIKLNNSDGRTGGRDDRTPGIPRRGRGGMEKHGGVSKPDLRDTVARLRNAGDEEKYRQKLCGYLMKTRVSSRSGMRVEI